MGYTEGYLGDKCPERILKNNQISKILLNARSEQTITSASPLILEEGYILAIKSIDNNGNKVTLELSKDGAVVDIKVISPSIDNAEVSDRTYYYKIPQLGETKHVVVIAVHFKNAFHRADQNLATADYIWQISGQPTLML